MTVIVGVIKNGKGVIASDSLYVAGNLKSPPELMVNDRKIYHVGDSYLGTTGWSAIGNIIESLIRNHMDKIDFSTRETIFDSLLALHTIMKDEYFLEISEDSDQPVESNHLWGLILNKNGMFVTSSYRNINEYSKYWAIGSGKEFALGSLHSTYNSINDSAEIAELAVKAACDFDDSCGLPIQIQCVEMG